MIFSDFLMVEQILFLPQVKQRVIISNKLDISMTNMKNVCHDILYQLTKFHGLIVFTF